MKLISRKKPKRIDPEWLIVSYMIMNNRVMGATYQRYKAGELKTNHFTDYFRPVIRWLLNYYGKYGKAPKKTIQIIFRDRRKTLGQNAEIIEEYLSRLSNEYINFQEDHTISPEYIIRDVLINFVRQKEMEELLQKAGLKLEQGETEAAEGIITKYNRINEVEEDEELGTITPFTKDSILEHYSRKQKEDVAFQFSGPLGQLIGPMEKGWLVAITGIEKGGKSYVIQEMAYDSALFQKKKVLICNFELNKKLVRNRLYRRITCTSNKAEEVIYPIFDCQNNQQHTCKILKRFPNKKLLITNPNENIDYFSRPDWETCTKCKEIQIRSNARKSKRYIPAIWFTTKNIRELSENRAKRAIKRNKYLGLKNLRIKCFPRFSATFDETQAYIMRYIEKKKWKPDIIFFDYLDIMGNEPGGNNMQERTDIDRKWKKAARLAGELNCLVVTADQANKPSREQRSLTQMSTSESKTKDAHLDIRIAINQIPQEKSLDLARISVLFHRHAEFNADREIMVTQRLKTSEPFCDTVFWNSKKLHYPVNNGKNVEI